MVLLEASSDSTQVIVAVATLIGTMFTGFLGFLTIKNTREAAVKTAAVAADTKEIKVQASAIEQQGNSRAAAMQKKIDDSLREIDELKKMVAQLTPGARAAGVRAADAKAEKEDSGAKTAAEEPDPPGNPSRH